MTAQATLDNPTPYISPPAFPKDMTLAQRIELDKARGEDGKESVYEPLKHEGTGVDSDELHYESHLLNMEEACKVFRGAEYEYVVRLGWDLTQKRLKQEEHERLKLEQARRSDQIEKEMLST